MNVNLLFWAAVVLVVALAPIVVLVQGPLSVLLGLADFLVAVALVCVWLERRVRGARSP